MKVTVFGAGAWGTALASQVSKAHDVLLWGRDEQVIQSIQVHHQNPRYLPSIPLCSKLQATTDFQHAALHALVGGHTDALWVLGVPMGALRSVLQQLLGVCAVSAWPKLVWLCKGFEENTALMPHQVVESVLGLPLGGALTGPSFASEVAQGLPCALTAASADAATRDVLVRAVHHGAVRVYGLEDLVGAEVGGAMKNVMALATGLSDGLQLGLNARAALVTRGLSEMKRLALVLGAQAETLNGLSGLGDLLLTATGDLSRNRRVGLMLAQGKQLSEILQELGQVAEGVKCAAVVSPLAKSLGVDMPITQMVNSVLFEGMSPQKAVVHLLAREAKLESV